MGVSRVDYAGETLVDLTGDSVAPNNLLKGSTAHGADGEPVDGAVTAVPTTTSLAVTEEGVSALDGTVGKVLNDKGSQISLYQAEDGSWHFRNWDGADTVIPFSNKKKYIVTSNINVQVANTGGVGIKSVQYVVNIVVNSDGPKVSISLNGSQKDLGQTYNYIRYINAGFYGTNITMEEI